MKKEFITYWEPEPIEQRAMRKLKSASQYFQEVRGHKDEVVEIIFPSEIRHDQLIGFIGKKTKVTIEVVS